MESLKRDRVCSAAIGPGILCVTQLVIVTLRHTLHAFYFLTKLSIFTFFSHCFMVEVHTILQPQGTWGSHALPCSTKTYFWLSSCWKVTDI